MSNTYTIKIGLAKPADNDTGWGVPIRSNLDAIDSLAPVGGLAVRPVEIPSASLNVKVAAGSYRKADGSAGSYAGTATQAMTTGATNYVYLTDAGVLTVNTTGFPVNAAHVPIAIVVAGTSTITSITDARTPFRTCLGGQVEAVASKSAAYSATEADSFIRADATTAAFTITLPAAPPTGKQFRVKRSNAGANNVTVSAASAKTFDGAASKVLSTQYACLTVVYNGTNYDVVSTFGTVS